VRLGALLSEVTVKIEFCRQGRRRAWYTREHHRGQRQEHDNVHRWRAHGRGQRLPVVPRAAEFMTAVRAVSPSCT